MCISQSTTMCKGAPSVCLSLPIMPWVPRPAFLPVPLTNTNHEHSDSRHLLPDFYLQNTCKLALITNGGPACVFEQICAAPHIRTLCGVSVVENDTKGMSPIVQIPRNGDLT